jgi:hypothetical protein
VAGPPSPDCDASCHRLPGGARQGQGATEKDECHSERMITVRPFTPRHRESSHQQGLPSQAGHLGVHMHTPTHPRQRTHANAPTPTHPRQRTDVKENVLSVFQRGERPFGRYGRVRKRFVVSAGSPASMHST